MKNLILKTFYPIILLLSISLQAQNFSGKENSEIAQMFISQTNFGKDKVKAKAFQSNLHQHLSTQFKNNSGAMNIGMSVIFSKIYDVNKDASFEFLMTTHNRNSMKEMLTYFTKEERDWIRQKSQARIKNYVKNQNNSTTTTTTSNQQISPYTNKPYEFDKMGFYDLNFRHSNFKIFFPSATLYSDYNPLYLPAMKYKFRFAPTGIVKDLDYKRTHYKGSDFVSFRFVPNTYNNPLSESESMVLYAVAANHLFPSEVYKNVKKNGDIYVIDSHVNSIGGYNSIVLFSRNIAMKAYKSKWGKEVIIQLVRTKNPIYQFSDFTPEEEHFLLFCVKEES